MRCFEGHPHRLTLVEMARCSNLNVSTTHRLLQTLCSTGVLRREADSDLYDLGPVLMSLSRTAYTSVGFTEATDLMHRLVLRTGLSASYAIREDDHVVVVLTAGSLDPVPLTRRPGGRSPLHASAVGKALLAFAERPHEQLVEELGELPSLTPATITTRKRLVADLARTRKRGFAFSDEEQIMGVRSIAAPVLDADGVAMGAVAVFGSVDQLPDRSIDEVSAVVREVAADLAAIEFAALLTS